MHDRVVAGRVVTPDGIVESGWVAIAGDSVAAIGQGERPPAKETIDYGVAFLLPGGVDGQTHAGSQIGFPGMAPTTKAAVMGGVTTIVDMPYDEPDPVTTRDLLDAKVAAVHAHAVCDVALYGTVPAAPAAADIAALIDGGVCAFKISSFESHPHRFPRIDNGAARYLIEALAGTGLPLGLHNEDQDLVRRTTKAFIAEGRTAAVNHSDSRPEIAEMAATAAFFELGGELDTPLHIVHISTPRGFELVRYHREAGRPATGEMCVHYLHFDGAADMARLGGLLKVNPPIRPGHREALWAVLESDGAAFVSSDHSAWPIGRKNSASIFEVAAGMPGLEALMPVFFTDAAARRGADAAALMTAKFVAERPARFFGLARKGRLVPGNDADIAVFAPRPYVYDSTRNPEGPGWSAYDGETFTATPIATYVRGTLAWDGDKVTVPTGSGRYVRRSAVNA